MSGTIRSRTEAQRDLAETARVELVCALRSPDARNREPDLAAAHRAVCSILVAAKDTLTDLENARHEDHGLHHTELVAIVPDPAWGETDPDSRGAT